MPKSPREPARLIRSGFGTEVPLWLAMPPSDSVTDASVEFLCSRVSSQVRTLGVTPSELARTLGESEASWRSKLNGNRQFDVNDLVGIALAFDPNILKIMATDSGDLGQLLPETYRPLLSHTTGGAGLPSFHSTAVAWTSIAAAVAKWWRSESLGGRGWACTKDVVAHQILGMLDSMGLPSSLASPRYSTTSGAAADVEWLARSTRFRLIWIDPSGPVNATTSRGSLRTVAAAIWEISTDRDGSDSETIVAVFAQTQVLAGLEDVLGLGGLSRPDTWVIASLSEAERLGLKEDVAELADIHLRAVASRPADVPILWLQAKV